ncbi:MAG TPA: hypothetical protein VII56_09965 [Rhizomicrobium sp.]
MPIRDDPRLSVVVGGHTVGENLQRAIDEGVVVLQKNGKLRMASALPTPDDGSTLVRHVTLMRHAGEFRQPCRFLNDFLFDQVYAQSAVPFGCRNCYKVKVTTDNPRQLLALRPIVDGTGQTAKSGIETDTGNDESRFSTLFYSLGLDRARALHRELRARIDAHPLLGPNIGMKIKRGCSNYELKCGPSDGYAFDPRLEAVEAYLRSLFRRKEMSRRDKLSLRLRAAGQMLWVARAYLRSRRLPWRPASGKRAASPPIVNYSVD